MAPPLKHRLVLENRNEELKAIHALLRRKNRAGLGQAIRGLGGVGKTQTAIAYAERYREKYQDVLWTSADGEGELIGGFGKIADELGLPHDPRDAQSAVAAVKKWLRTESDWLLVFDNADQPRLLEGFLPPASAKGRVLVTSRDRDADDVLGIDDPLLLDCLDVIPATEFLLERSGRTGTGDEERSAAARIAEEVGGLPARPGAGGGVRPEAQGAVGGLPGQLPPAAVGVARTGRRPERPSFGGRHDLAVEL